MIIPIDEKYRIKSNKYCWMIQEYGNNKNKETGEIETTWTSFKWCNSFEDVVNTLAQLMIRTSSAETLAEALVDVDRVVVTLSRALMPKIEVNDQSIYPVRVSDGKVFIDDKE